MGIGAREGLGWTGTIDRTILRFKFLPKKDQGAPAKERSTATIRNLIDRIIIKQQPKL